MTNLKKKKLLQTNYSRQKHKTLSQIKPKSPNKWSIFICRRYFKQLIHNT
ncbi:hypothetical protein HanRHA438_Chr08g0342811 [Helianthus annuus]|nr:hypothetical protein HanRHA438_Chr08g0342811 [Helianthus annuus]